MFTSSDSHETYTNLSWPEQSVKCHLWYTHVSFDSRMTRENTFPRLVARSACGRLSANLAIVPSSFRYSSHRVLARKWIQRTRIRIRLSNFSVWADIRQTTTRMYTRLINKILLKFCESLIWNKREHLYKKKTVSKSQRNMELVLRLAVEKS